MHRVVTCLLLVALALSNDALALGYVYGKVVSVRVDIDGRGMVAFDRPVGNQPASCRVGTYENALAFDANTPGGKAVLATALAAKATGDLVAAYGTGNCNIYGGSYVEDWAYGVVQ
jgi:hypothetical protein